MRSGADDTGHWDKVLHGVLVWICIINGLKAQATNAFGVVSRFLSRFWIVGLSRMRVTILLASCLSRLAGSKPVERESVEVSPGPMLLPGSSRGRMKRSPGSISSRQHSSKASHWRRERLN